MHPSTLRTRLLALSAFLAIAAGVVWAQDPAQDPKAPPQPPAAGAAGRPEMDWTKVAMPLKGDSFLFHLRDIDGVAASSSDYWGKVVLIYVVSTEMSAQLLPEFRAIVPAIEAKGSSVALVGIVVSPPDVGKAHVKKARELIQKFRLPGSRFFVAPPEFLADRFVNVTQPLPYFVFVGKDGKGQESTYMWSRKMPERVAEVSERLLREPAPSGQRPAPPPLQEVQELQMNAPSSDSGVQMGG